MKTTRASRCPFVYQVPRPVRYLTGCRRHAGPARTPVADTLDTNARTRKGSGRIKRVYRPARRQQRGRAGTACGRGVRSRASRARTRLGAREPKREPTGKMLDRRSREDTAHVVGTTRRRVEKGAHRRCRIRGCSSLAEGQRRRHDAAMCTPSNCVVVVVVAGSRDRRGHRVSNP
jgi:hypothetical protein